jgi:hypothetical protein
MDFTTILGIIIILVVAAALIVALRIYQRVRVDTGYHTGKFYKRGQHMGAYIGNYHMDEMGVGKESADGRIESDEEMFLFSENDKQ